MRVISLILLIGVTIVTPATAQNLGPKVRQSPTTPLFKPSAPLFPVGPAPSAPSLKPSSPLFPVDPNAPPQALRQRGPLPRIVCGMVLVPGDPSIDPEMTHPVPSNGTRFTLKTIRPPMCSQ
jgi:hypothetical protein